MSCHLCKQKAAIYTCPNCSIKYCSVKCYRSTSHRHCSEAFYRNEVLSELQTENTDPGNETAFTQIVGVLKEALLANENNPNTKHASADSKATHKDDASQTEDGRNEQVEEDLETRLEGLDLSRDTAVIWSRLTKQERAEFLRQYTDGSLERLVTKNSTLWWQQPDAANWPTSVLDCVVQPSGAIRNADETQLRLTLVRTLFSYTFALRSCGFEFDTATDDEVSQTVDRFLRLSDLANSSLRHHDLQTTVAQCNLTATELLAASTRGLQVSPGRGASRLKVLLPPREVCDADVNTAVKTPSSSFEYTAIVLADLVTLLRRRLVERALAHACALVRDARHLEEQDSDKDLEAGRLTQTRGAGPSRRRVLFLAEKKLEYLVSWHAQNARQLEQNDAETLISNVELLRMRYEAECASFNSLNEQVKASNVRETIRTINSGENEHSKQLITELN